MKKKVTIITTAIALSAFGLFTAKFEKKKEVIEITADTLKTLDTLKIDTLNQTINDTIRRN